MATNFTNFGSTFMIWDVAVLQARMNELLTPALVAPTALDFFSTYFSDLPAPSGIISVPIITYPSAASSLTDGPVLTGATSSVQQLTVNNDIGTFFPFQPADAQQYGLDNLINSWIAPALYSCDRTISSASLGVVLNPSNFNSMSFVAPNSSSLGVAMAGKIHSELSNLGINGERWIVATPNYYWALTTNIAQLGNPAGAAALAAGDPNNPLRLRVLEGQDLPALPTDTANTSSVVAITGVKSSVAVGTAIPNVVHANGQSVVITSPKTGVKYLLESYYNENSRQWIIGTSVIYGVTNVQNTARRILSK